MPMLRIRAEQMIAMEIALQHPLHRRIAQHVREKYALHVAHLDDAQLRDKVTAAAERAAGFGFVWQTSVLAFVSLTFTVGPYFDQHPRIAAILGDRRVPADSRIEYLADAISATEWDEARYMSAPSRVRPRE
jgi:hypothetical protein